MENKNIFLGQLKKQSCYVNDGKYGYFLTYNKKNYKIPEWFPHEKMNLEIAERFIEYKDKMNQLYSDKEPKKEKSELDVESEEESEDEKDKINKKFIKKK